MNELQIRFPSASIREVTRLFIPDDTPPESLLELSIVIESKDVAVREFSSYLSLLDRFYGRLQPFSIYAYGHRPDQQLRISEARSGSIELVITQLLSAVGSADRLVVLFLLMKYLPNVIKSSAEAVRNLAGAYKDIQEGLQIREERANRKRLRNAIRDDAQLHQLDSSRRDQLVKLLDSVYAIESEKLPSATRLAEKKVKQIRLGIKKRSQ